mgnify:CR=1 FL=1
MILGKFLSLVVCSLDWFKWADDILVSVHPGKSGSNSEKAWVAVASFLVAFSLL